MTIKRNSDKQITCTISASELAERQLSISDISYGSKEAKTLVKEIMKVARDEFNFSSEDLPLVIETVPLENDDVMFIITKNEYPEELDARFSRFSPADESEYPPLGAEEPETEDSASNLFKHLENLAQEMSEEEEVDTAKKGNSPTPKAPPYMIYSFNSMENLINLAKLLSNELPLPSTIYKTGQNQGLLLLVSPGEMPADKFKSVCEVISEYSSKDRRLKGSDLLLKEHYKPVIENDALNILSNL